MMCGKKFFTYPSFVKVGEGFLCSIKCKHEWTAKNYIGRKSFKNCQEAPKAWSLFNHKVDKNEIKRMPCEICGNIKTHGHHEDYSKPFEVNWLCAKHHQLIHTGKLKINKL